MSLVNRFLCNQKLHFFYFVDYFFFSLSTIRLSFSRIRISALVKRTHTDGNTISFRLVHNIDRFDNNNRHICQPVTVVSQWYNTISECVCVCLVYCERAPHNKNVKFIVQTNNWIDSTIRNNITKPTNASQQQQQLAVNAERKKNYMIHEEL